MSDRRRESGDDSRLRRALGAIRGLKAELEKLKREKSEPVAVVGMGCRFPGGASDPQSFWRLLRDGFDGVSDIPSSRWRLEEYYDPDPEKPGKMYIRRAALLPDLEDFDAAFFGISPREALSLDPQQRLVLEVGWEALENAGQAPDKLKGSRTAVIVGVTLNDYEEVLRRQGPEAIDAYYMSGTSLSFAAGRVAYVLGLHGPAMTVDTACSASLTAVHLACRSLRGGECDLALAGGAHVILSPERAVMVCKTRMASADGRCKAFDAKADGLVPGEGCGIVVLKRLSDALANGDDILALIRGSAVNQDGPSSGLTVPNGLAQEALIRAALEDGGVAPEQVGYVEAHGTGTSLGDPIEVAAIGAVLGRGRPADRRLALGSVKTNVGHLESAAGIIGLIKAILIVRHGEIPPHLHLERVNPHISLEASGTYVPTKLTPWRSALRPRIAGVSSFGASGTNAHVIVEEPPASAASEMGDAPRHLLCLSAKTETALRALAARFADHLSSGIAARLGDVCFTAQTGRAHFAHRLAVSGSSAAEIGGALSTYGRGEAAPAVLRGNARAKAFPDVVFMFTGQGAQYVGMGRHLHETQPAFREALDRCDDVLRPHLERPLLAVLYPGRDEDSPLHETRYTQPALFAVEYALAAMWASWGVKPAVVLGHSVGEYVAACVAGVFGLEDGLRLIAERGRLMQALPADGAMAAVFASESLVTDALAGMDGHLSIAAINGPCNVVISGRAAAVDEVVERLAGQGVRAKRLNVSHAFHSPLMEPMLDEFERTASQVAYGSPRTPLISNITGRLVDADLVGQAGYWRRHVREPVRFAASMQTLLAQGPRVFLEVGPGATLLGMGSQCVPDEDRVWLASLREGREDWSQVLESAGGLYVNGAELDWSGLHRPYARRRVPLPTYPFERRRFWPGGTAARRAGGRDQAGATKVLRWIQEGNTAELRRELETANGFSEAETHLLPRLLETLVGRHRDEAAAMSTHEWLYEIEWRDRPRASQTTASEAQPDGVWLVFADREGIGRAVGTRLADQGQRCLLVRPGEGQARAEGEEWRIDPGRPGDYDWLLEAIAAGQRAPLRGVVHLWSLDTVQAQAVTVEALSGAQRLACGSVLHLARALARAPRDSAPKLWAVTRGAVPAEDTPRAASLGQAPVWGLYRAFALERPDLRGGIVDLPADAAADEAERLFAELWESQGEDQVALRRSGRYVPRLVRCKPPATEGPRFAADGTYLITGGLGGLGLEIARWMVGRGARHFVLVGRRGAATDEARALVGQLEQSGASVLVARADVASADDMSRVFRDMDGSMPPLRGIVHAAGVPGYQPLEEIDSESLESVMRPKLEGTWVLHQLSREVRLDFFVCFSSIASVWGSRGQTHYSAANAFLDSFAHSLRGLGQVALSVNWGLWASGMATPEFTSYVARLGFEAMAPERAVVALGQAMELGRPQMTVAQVDWSAFKPIYEARGRRPFLDEIQVRAEQAAGVREQVGPSPLRQRLDKAPAGQRMSLLITHIQGEVAAVMGFAPSDVPDPQRGFAEMGMDSLMAVELGKRLQRSLGRALPATLAFDYPDVQALAGHLLGDVLAPLPEAEEKGPSLEKAPESMAEVLQEIKGLSDERIESLIAEELDALGRK